MVLSDRSIKEELAKGRIVIEPLDPTCIQPASVDLRLGRKIRVFRRHRFQVIDVKQEMEGLTEPLEIDEINPFVLHPGEFALGMTLEEIHLPGDIVARLDGKSSLGRLGLIVHSTAGFVDPGWKGHLTLEFSNLAALPINLYFGMKVSQISFLRLTKPAEHLYGSKAVGSKYQGQTEPTPSRSHQDYKKTSLSNLSSLSIAGELKASRNGNALKKWLKQSEFRGSVKRFSDALVVPLKTLEDWLYRGAEPSLTNRAKLFAITKLPQFRVGYTMASPELPLNLDTNS